MTDHREVEELLGRTGEPPPGPGDREVHAGQAAIEPIRHSAPEEACPHPAVREHMENGEAPADRELGDHTTVERTMKDPGAATRAIPSSTGSPAR